MRKHLKHLPEAAAVLACCLAAACLFQIGSLRGELGSLRSQLGSQLSRVDASVQSIDSTVVSRLEQDASLLAGQEFRYEGEPDPAGRTVRLRCTVIPKEVAPGRTEATLYWSGGETAMAYEKGAFSAVLSVPLFSDSSVSRVVLSQDGTLRTELLERHFSPRTELLPCFSAWLDGSATVSGGLYHWKGSLCLDDMWGDGHLPDTAVLIEFLNGVEQGRTELAPEEDAHGEHQRRYAVDTAYELLGDGLYELWVEAADRYGLRYRVLLERWTTDAQGNVSPGDGWEWLGSEPEIYDAKGNLLYRPEPVQ